MARSPRNSKLAAHVRSASHAVRNKNYKKLKRSGRKNELRSMSEEKDWKNATCSICLEHPHDAVLLLCSSHNKGCRPYMCGTNYRHSNCLELFKNAYSREKLSCEVSNAVEPTNHKPKTMLLACPICRGEVKGCTVVKPARRFLNRKRRACMHEDCSFVGTYKRLKKHVKSKHRSSKPREVDPAHLAEWEEFENEKERQDAISIFRALNPESVIMGDYIIDPDGDISDPYSNDSLGDFGYSDDSLDDFGYSDDSLGDFGYSISSDSDDEGYYDRHRVHRVRAYRRNGERPSRNLTYVGRLPPHWPLRFGFVHRSLSQPRNS